MPTAAQAKRRLLGLGRQHVAMLLFCTEDVIGLGKEKHVRIGRRQADAIIDEIDRRQDCSIGVTWDTLDYYIDQLVMDRRQRARERKAEERS